MSSLLDDGVQSRMQRLFLRKGTPYSAVPSEDSAAQRDSDRQVLDANEAKDVNAQQSEAPSEPQSAAAEAGAETAEVLATATLLGANGVASDSHQATNAPKAFKKTSKGLLGCLHFSKKEKEEKPIDGLPYAFNNRQSIFKRLARSAKMSAPVTVVERTPKPVKVCLLTRGGVKGWLLAVAHCVWHAYMPVACDCASFTCTALHGALHGPSKAQLQSCCINSFQFNTYR